jgi:prepilin-type N-terminal cleavage/methylation domain-containing protein
MGKNKLTRLRKQQGFTLIELMIVMSIVALLMGLVGPLAINSLEKAQAKQELLTVKNWLKKISYRAFTTGQTHIVKLAGKNVMLYSKGQQTMPIENRDFEALFFQPQELIYNKKGIVSPSNLVGTYKGQPLLLNLTEWVNGEEPVAEQNANFSS